LISREKKKHHFTVMFFLLFLGSNLVREREGGSSTIQTLYFGFAEISIFIVSFFNARPAKIPPKKHKDTKRILRNTFPQTPSISQNLARVPHLHFRTPPLPRTFAVCGAFPALLASCQKHHASRGGASAREER